MLREPLQIQGNACASVDLGELPDPQLRHAVLALLQRRAFFLTGAGASAASPTCLPTGPELAAKMVKWACDSGFTGALSDVVDKTDLGEVCAALDADAGRSALNNWLVRAAKWQSSEYNLGHLAIALLFAEGILTHSFTANWDPKIEDASEVITSSKPLRFPYDKATMNVAGGDSLMIHVHGSYRAPDSMIATTAELNEPNAMRWSDPNIRATLSTRDPILLGFATEPTYILESLRELGETMERPPASVVALDSFKTFRERSPSLVEALKLDQHTDHYVEGDACEVMGELLRCCYSDLLKKALDDAVQRAKKCGGTRLSLSSEGEDRIRDLLLAQPVVSLLSFLWYAAARPSQTGSCCQPTLGPQQEHFADCAAAAMLLASCADVSGVELTRGAFRLMREAEGPVDLWPLMPEELLNPTDAQDRVYRRSGRFSAASDADIPLALLCSRTVGAVPDSSRVSLVGTKSAKDISGGSRPPSDVLTLSELDGRIKALGEGDRLRLAEVVHQ